MDAERQKARWRRRRIIYNNDGDDALEARSGVEFEHDVAESLMVRSSGDLAQDFLDARSTPLIGSQVDSNWFASAMAGLTFSHHTRLGGFYGKEVPLELVEKYGRDALEIQLDFSHEHGMEAVWCLRMNDVHDSHPMGSRRWNYGLAKFKRENPQYMMGKEGDWEKYEKQNEVLKWWTRLDFSFEEVRDHIFGVIEEVALNYDVDLIGMEFFKYWPFFRESRDGDPVTPEHLETMNDLMRRIRSMADEVGKRRGRPLLLSAQTPFSLEDCIHVGLDLETWLKEDLIDQFCPGGGKESVFRDSYTEIVALGHKYEVPVYPCIMYSFWGHWVFLDHSEGRFRHFPDWLETLYGGQPDRKGKPSYILVFNAWEGVFPAWRGAAMNLFDAGADGLYIFNPALGEPRWWFEIGEVETMAGKDRIYGIDCFEGRDSFSSTSEVELELDAAVATTFQVGEDVSAAGARNIDLRIHLWNHVPGDGVTVNLNGSPIDGLAPADPGRDPSKGQWLQGDLNAGLVARGRNVLEVTARKRGASASATLAMDSAQIRVRCES